LYKIHSVFAVITNFIVIINIAKIVAFENSGVAAVSCSE